MKVISTNEVNKIFSKTPSESTQLIKTVNSIIQNVKNKGDTAIKAYEKKFTGVSLKSLRVKNSEIRNAYSKVDSNQIKALLLAKKRLEKTETSLRKLLKNIVVNQPGIKIKKIFSPIDSVGCYVPGGSARYPSSLIMSVIPAKIAGVKRIVCVSPCDKKGEIDPLTLVASDICKVDEFYKIGGAQAIAALSYGTKTIPKVVKIVGPGGPFVSIAKSLVSVDTSIDMNAGPTELAIIADNSCNPDTVSKDLFSQAEHSPNSMCMVFSSSKVFAEKLNNSIKKNISKIPRKDMVKKSLSKGFIAIGNQKQIIDKINQISPEHLQIMTKDTSFFSKNIRNGPMVLIGKNSPSSASDYLFGSNHILPTNGFGKSRGSLSVFDFIKISTEAQSTTHGLKTISNSLKVLTDAEGLPNHYEPIYWRLK